MIDLNKHNYIFKVYTTESNVYRILRRIKPLTSIYSTQVIDRSSTTVLRFLGYIPRVDCLNSKNNYSVERHGVSYCAPNYL